MARPSEVIPLLSTGGKECGCTKLAQRVAELEAEREKLLAALRREAHHIEERRVHDGKPMVELRKWLKRD